MNLKLLTTLCFVSMLFSRCSEPPAPEFMSEYLSSEDIRRVEMSNVNGTFILSENQLTRFKKEFLATKTVPGLAIKTGSLSMIITLQDGQTYVVRGGSRSDFLEVSSQIATHNKESLTRTKWLVLDTKDVNFNNYRPH